jgi:hypothetical protein
MGTHLFSCEQEVHQRFSEVGMKGEPLGAFFSARVKLIEQLSLSEDGLCIAVGRCAFRLKVWGILRMGRLVYLSLHKLFFAVWTLHGPARHCFQTPEPRLFL